MAIETLGYASFPSGRAVLVDTGVLIELGEQAYTEHGAVLDGVKAGVLPIRGERVGGDDGDCADLWREIWLELGDGEVVASDEVGAVVVDCARLMFVDGDAAASWDDKGGFDGKADFLFWGRDAEALAAAVGAPARGEGQYGWCDLPVDEAIARGTEAERLKGERGWKLATDFRPHTHYYFLLAQARDSLTGSGTLDLESSKTCLFFTSWGDGIFPVIVDRDVHGAPVRFRVVFLMDDDDAREPASQLN